MNKYTIKPIHQATYVYAVGCHIFKDINLIILIAATSYATTHFLFGFSFHNTLEQTKF